MLVIVMLFVLVLVSDGLYPLQSQVGTEMLLVTMKDSGGWFALLRTGSSLQAECLHELLGCLGLDIIAESLLNHPSPIMKAFPLHCGIRVLSVYMSRALRHSAVKT